MATRGPALSRISVPTWSSIVSMPPIPEPISTPTRFASYFVMSMPESAIAFLAAPTAYCVKRSVRRVSLIGMKSSGLKSLHLATDLTVEIRGVESGDGPNAALTGEQISAKIPPTHCPAA